MKAKIVLADDHKLFRDGLRSLLEQHAGLEVVGEARDGMAVVQLARDLSPDIILMDVSMPELNGIEATRRVLDENPAIRIVILSMHSDQRFVTESLKAGARGYVLKDSAIGELLQVIHTVMDGGVFLSRALSDRVIKDYIKLVGKSEDSAFTVLSAREREVLQLLAEGKPTKEIADQLCLSVKTIETHRKQIMNKLDLHSIAELTKYAIREGLTPLD